MRRLLIRYSSAFKCIRDPPLTNVQSSHLLRCSLESLSSYVFPSHNNAYLQPRIQSARQSGRRYRVMVLVRPMGKALGRLLQRRSGEERHRVVSFQDRHSSPSPPVRSEIDFLGTCRGFLMRASGWHWFRFVGMAPNPLGSTALLQPHLGTAPHRLPELAIGY
ncbi:uncharacterized protein ARMOST_11456 [Armillaria ostoyae]|uniref:Uncharacterized protein n=1 Tax=Armillaria ostoyae TaxID=47428 RepID=A0A284RH68_ARMOS|nr:uncharacterized protein ARMOST_11456 [Armillaria ostoyae]